MRVVRRDYSLAAKISPSPISFKHLELGDIGRGREAVVGE